MEEVINGILIREVETKNIMTKSNLPVGGYSVNPYPVQRGRGHRPHPDLQCWTAKAAGSVQQKVPRPLPPGKILRPGRRDLCAGQVQTVYPAASTVQRGTQTESKRERKANRVQEPDGIM